MEAVIDILVFGFVCVLIWVALLEYRYRTLKNARANSEELVQQLIDEAEVMLAKVEGKLKGKR
jgi:hypothetical protein